MVQSQRDPWRTGSILLGFLISYHVALSLMHVVTAYLTGEPINPSDRVFDYRETHIQTLAGYRTCLVHLLTACLLVPVEVLQIARAKLVLDFAMTAQVFHLILTSLYSGRYPNTWTWWGVWLLSSFIMVFGGEYACMLIELRPIQFGTTVQESAQTQTARMSTSTRSGRVSNVSNTQSMDDIELQERDALMEQGQASRIQE